MPQITENSSHINLCTSMGEIRIELYWKHTPKTCKNFSELCKKQYYNNTIFHRIIPGFMVQAGDPTGNLTVGYVCIMKICIWYT